MLNSYAANAKCFESTLGGGLGVGCYAHSCGSNPSVDGVSIAVASGASVLCLPEDSGTPKPVSGLTGAIICPDIATICPPPSCFDGVMNADETEIDCGGHCAAQGFCRVWDVVVVGNSFSPSVVNVKRGDYVRWSWSGALHNVREAASAGSCAAAAQAFSSGIPSTVGTYSRQFAFNGDHTYHCEVHCPSGMTGAMPGWRAMGMQNDSRR